MVNRMEWQEIAAVIMARDGKGGASFTGQAGVEDRA
jgi:hypothetical protein